MSALDAVAAQRDEMSMKNRDLARQLDAAKAEIARLKGAVVPVAPPSGIAVVPSTGPLKAKDKTRRIR